MRQRMGRPIVNTNYRPGSLGMGAKSQPPSVADLATGRAGGGPQFKYVAGWDPGERQDPAAFCILEIVEMPSVDGKPSLASYNLVLLKEWKRVLYPQQIMRIKAIMSREPYLGRTLLVTDAGGVGRMPAETLDALKLAPTLKVTTTGGMRIGGQAGDVSVPKANLVGLITMMIQTVDTEGKQRLRIQESRERGDILDRTNMQMKSFEGGFSRTGKATFEAGSGHDDIVSCIGLAIYGGEHRPRSGGGYVRPTSIRGVLPGGGR